jgi:arylsulfatase A-like enzyme
MLGSRAVWHKGWKAVSVHPTIAGWGHFDQDRWEFFHTDEDPTESRDLASEQPAKPQELINVWWAARSGRRSSTSPASFTSMSRPRRSR